MATRKASFDVDDEQEHPSKRQRRIQEESRTNEDAIAVAAPSLDSLNDDCLLNILSHTPIKHLNTLACCNQRLCAMRAHESLDQSREGTIIMREGSTFESLCNAIVNNNWNEDFQGNMTKVTITGMENIRLYGRVAERFRWRRRSYQMEREAQARQDAQDLMRGQQSQLSGVTSVTLTCSPNAVNRKIDNLAVLCLPYIFPNLVSVDLSDLVNIIVPVTICMRFAMHCPQLSRLVWKGHDKPDGLSLEGYEFHNAANLTELYLDGCRFSTGGPHTREFMDRFADETSEQYLFHRCPRQPERLSIKNVTDGVGRGHEPRAPTQEMLIKMVRRNPALRWLRSDLSEENIVMLRQERPEVTFVSD